MKEKENNINTAQALYGAGWHQLPDFVKEAAADFVPVLLELNATSVLNGYAMDLVHELADGAVPVYDYDRYAVLADIDAVRAIEAALLEFGADAVKDADGHVSLSAFIGVGIYGAVTATLSQLVFAVAFSECWDAFGLDADAAEIAARLLPEWSGTVAELVAAAASLEVAR
jgi:hypothetical protein